MHVQYRWILTGTESDSYLFIIGISSIVSTHLAVLDYIISITSISYYVNLYLVRTQVALVRGMIPPIEPLHGQASVWQFSQAPG